MDDRNDDGRFDRRTVLKTLGAGTFAAASGLGTGTVAADESDNHYHNPIGPVGFGDVSIIDDGNGTYYAYGTETPEDIIPIAQSTNMADWQYIGSALDSTPTWHPTESDPGCWAPDIRYHNGQYHLYYSLSVWGSDNAGIGLATSNTPDGPFADQGPVIQSGDLNLTNCIDAETVMVNGQPWLIWGSFEGIYAVQMNDAMDDIVPGTEFHMAGNNREGAMMVQENGYYYLFYSTGECCDGYESTYEVEVGRAESFTGPYYNQNGTDLRDLNEHHSGVAVLQGDDYFTGPGHNDAYQDWNGDWWLFYHVEATADDETRYMMLDRIQWDDNDWPVIACDGTPSQQSPMPGSGSYSCGGGGGAITEGTYRITNANSGKLLEVASAGTADGDNVQQYADTGHTCQQWDVTDNGDGTYTLTNVNSGLLLEVAGAGTANGDTLQQYADTGHACQDWNIIDNGDGTYRLENANSGKVADVDGASTADGADVIQYTWNGGANQRWTFETV